MTHAPHSIRCEGASALTSSPRFSASLYPSGDHAGHSTGNAVIAPRAILSGHPYYHILDLLTDAGTSNRRARQGVNRLVHELTMPGEAGVGLRNRGDLC